MLSDLQKIQAHMHIFFTKFGSNQLDPEAGQARPENILIMNDPDFVPDMRLPQFDLDALVANSQATNKTSSQMSPLDNTLLSGSGSQGSGFNIHFDLHHSDSFVSQGPPFGLQGLSSSQKPEAAPFIMNQEDEFAGPGDWGMEIDEDGNIIDLNEPAGLQDQDDLELPPLPSMEDQNHPEQQHQHHIDNNGDIIMTDAVQPETGGFPEKPQDEHGAFLDDHPHQAPSRRKKKVRGPVADEETQLSRTILRNWQGEYLDNCGARKVRTGAAQTKANAMLLTFGLGLGNIGQNLGVPGMVHPLGLDFSGDSLFTAITGLGILEKPRGKRRHRSATESIEEDDLEERRVRPRLDSEADQQGRGLEDDYVFHDQDAQIVNSPEVGRDAQAPMSDHLSSALRMPWNRGSSAVLGSSVRGSAQKGRIPSSPLGNRGNVQDLVRFSDDPILGDDGFDLGGLHSQDDSFDGFQLEDDGAEESEQKKDAWPTLDIEGANFLSFMHTAIHENGEHLQDDDFDENRKWIAFDDLFVPRETPRATAAHAFYHTLCLATKGDLEVQQDGEDKVPFGSIWVGTKLVDTADAEV
ncbi:uncharacterized protein F4812DRAFT_449036 [Daldinia caldariorum]|uniref:uncharacterized protein n=1 Tax=Daldinia caldariorum TaxID=326644 RepID=UPI0020076760|nr:uncharacterized protein F4812DRAFT_449036 [Daldinia caldariorum]KAI1472553.1 hypothetical protein F4812DRAFT_449036 [Daldinia caldariorum]